MAPRRYRTAIRTPFALVVGLCAAGCGSKTGLYVPDVSQSRDAHVEDATLGDTSNGVDASIASDTPDEAAGAIAAALTGLRWELPCESVVNASVCSTPASRTVSAMLHGAPGEHYAVTFRFRGVVEVKSYDGGVSPGGFWQIGGVPHADTVNAYGLTISSPAQQFYLNRVTVDAFACFAIDYDETVVLDGNATVTLDARSIDGHEVRNVDTQGHPIVIPGVAPAPEPFDGQFIQMDVLSIRRVP